MTSPSTGMCYDPNIINKEGMVRIICLDNLKYKWFPMIYLGNDVAQQQKPNEAQAIKPVGKRTKLYAMNNIYIQSEHQVQITFLSYQECATFCLSNHHAIMTFK
uniref:Uncharacterized protein n=1 Tax=Anser brachyrhynchus TaxID=132585 RepID=A0A8B9BS46_9AVES